MKTTKLIALLAALLCATTTSWAQTWLGSGNSTDPYLLKSGDEWEALAKQVAEGKNFQNQFSVCQPISTPRASRWVLRRSPSAAPSTATTTR